MITDRKKKVKVLQGNPTQDKKLGQSMEAVKGEDAGIIETAQDNPSALRDYDTTSVSKCATISVTEAANVLGCARSTVTEAIKRKQIPALRLGSSIRIPIAALKRTLETGDANPVVTEFIVRMDQRMAETVADMVTKRLLELENERLVEQIRELGGLVRL